MVGSLWAFNQQSVCLSVCVCACLPSHETPAFVLSITSFVFGIKYGQWSMVASSPLHAKYCITLGPVSALVYTPPLIGVAPFLKQDSLSNVIDKREREKCFI